ncbi:MAG: protein kinase [Ktedonobacterales bacterium]
MTAGRCARCGHEMPSNAHFCPGCGLDLHDRRPRAGTGLLHPSQLLHGRFKIERRLAQGGQSAVYLVSDAYADGAPLVLKEMSDSNLGPVELEKAINGFIREADMLRSLHHPALATVYNSFVEDQKHYLVMEYVRGHNLEDELIAVGRPLQWERVTSWGVVLCDVLSYLHSRRPPIIYRDLKPANVMLTPDGDLKLIDFGIARFLYAARTHDTTQLGTDGYAPLEQYTALSEPRSDLYALGASLYHLLTGRVPEGAPVRTAGQGLTPVRAINPSVPEELERIIMCAMALKASERFANAQEMCDALAQLLQPQPQLPPQRLAPGLTPASSYRSSPPLAPSSMPPGMAPPGMVRASVGPRLIGGARGSSGAPVRRSLQTALPKLRLWPLRLDAGFLELNEATTLRLELSNNGGGDLTGRVQTNHESLQVDPYEIGPETAELLVYIDTASLREGPYTCHLAVRTNGGDQIVPVRFIVRPALDASGSLPRMPLE